MWVSFRSSDLRQTLAFILLLLHLLKNFKKSIYRDLSTNLSSQYTLLITPFENLRHQVTFMNNFVPSVFC